MKKTLDTHLIDNNGLIVRVTYSAGSNILNFKASRLRLKVHPGA